MIKNDLGLFRENKSRLEGVVTQGKEKNYWSINDNIGIKPTGPMLVQVKDRRSLITGRFNFSDTPRQRQRTSENVKLQFNWNGHFRWPWHPGERRWFWLLALTNNWDILSWDFAYFTGKNDFQFGCQMVSFHYSLILRTLSVIWTVPQCMLFE